MSVPYGMRKMDHTFKEITLTGKRRIPYPAEVELAEAFLKSSKGHSCYICREGYADCGTIRDAEQAEAVVEAFKAGLELYEFDCWPLYYHPPLDN